MNLETTKSSTDSKSTLAAEQVKNSSVKTEVLVDGSKKNFFLIFSNGINKADWISYSRIIEIEEHLKKNKLNSTFYMLSMPKKGNHDEKREAKVGKTMQFLKEVDVVKIEIYLQQHGETPKLSHTHSIERKLFDAYTTVIMNDKNVLEMEQETKKKNKFTVSL